METASFFKVETRQVSNKEMVKKADQKPLALDKPAGKVSSHEVHSGDTDKTGVELDMNNIDESKFESY